MAMAMDMNVKRAAKEALLAGRYNLLIGAGISLDSLSSQNSPLPDAEKLRLHIIMEKGLKPTTTLSRAYRQLSESEVEKYFTTPYSNCIPGPTVNHIAQFFWKRIYTLNIDDSLDTAYQTLIGKQTPISLTHKSDYIHPESINNIQIVHIHGWSRRPSDGYIFSIPEYVDAMHPGNPWTTVLAQTISADPFIIAGTSLEEPDIEYFLKNRSVHTHRKERGPSFLVEPFPDSATEKDCERHGLTLYCGTMEEFLNFLENLAPSRPAPSASNPFFSKDLFIKEPNPRDLAYFYKSFQYIEPIQLEENLDYGFFVGEEPNIDDISLSRDIPRQNTNSIKAEINNALNSEVRKHDFIIIDGNAGTGKTTVLLRLLYELACDGTSIFIYKSNSSFDIDICASILRNFRDKFIIFCDNFADHVSGMIELYRQVVRNDMLIIGAERSYRMNYIGLTLGGIQYKTLQVGPFIEEEATSLIEKLNQYGLSSGKKSADTNQSKSLIDDNIAIATCRIMNDFKPIEKIIVSLTENADENRLSRYIACAIASHCYRSGLNYRILSSSFDSSGLSDQLYFRDILPLAFSDSQKEYITTAKPILGYRVLQHMAQYDGDIVFDSYCTIGRSIAPYVNRRTIIQRTPEARLAGRLFDFDEICFPILGSESEKFYIRMKDFWSWSSRYWEQLALLNVDKFDKSKDQKFISQAVSHARHAVKIEEHPLPLSTLGKVLIEEMRSIPTKRDSSYREAHDILCRAIKMESGMNRIAIHPYATLFKGTFFYLSLGGLLSSKQKEKLRELVKNAELHFGGDREVSLSIANIRLKIT